MSTRRAVLLVSLAITTWSCGESSATVQKTKPSASKPPATATPAPDAGDDSPQCPGGCPVPTPVDTAPQVEITEPVAGAKLSSKVLTVRGTAHDDQAGLELQVSTDATHWVHAPLVDGKYEVVLPLNDLDGERLAVIVEATDSAGHKLQTLQPIEVDNMAPRLSIDAIPSATAQQWLNGVALSGGAEDGSSLTLKIDLDDGRGFQNATASNGRWSQSFVAGASEDYVEHVLTIEATDRFGNTTIEHKEFVVDVVRPRITITSPPWNTKFNAADLAATGVVPITFTLQDGDPKAFVVEQGKPTHLTSLNVQTSLTDDGVPYEVTFEAADSAGNIETINHGFYVDRVAPRVTRMFPDDGAQTSDSYATVGFSEPVQTTQPGFTTAPPTLPGTWSADRRTYQGNINLADTAFTLSVLSQLTDDYGNRATVAPAPWRLTTRPMLAANGAVIASGVNLFSAATDEDGVLTVVAAQGSSARSYRADARTGGFIADAPVAVVPGEPLQAFAHRTLAPGASPHRVAGARVIANTSLPRVDWWQNRTLMSTPSPAASLIPSPAVSGEGAGLGAVGFIRNGLYERTGRASLAVAVRPDRVAAVDDRWEAVQLNANGFTRQTFLCSQPYANAAPACDVSPAWSQTGFGSTPRYSHAVTRNCSIHVYNDVNGRRTLFTEPFVTACRIGSCPTATTTTEAMTEELEVASATATTFVGARRNSSGVSLWSFTTDNACKWWPAMEGQLVANNVASFKPVRIGGRAALVWLDTNGTLQLFRP
jgi:hypothetical protein